MFEIKTFKGSLSSCLTFQDKIIGTQFIQFYFTESTKASWKRSRCRASEFRNTEHEAQLFQSWNRKQSLAIFQTGWSLFGEAWAVRRKFWLKNRCLFPSNLTIPPVTTSNVVWPWVACSEKRQCYEDATLSCCDYICCCFFCLKLFKLRWPWTGWQSRVWTWNSLDGSDSKKSPRASCPETALPFHTNVALSR